MTAQRLARELAGGQSGKSSSESSSIMWSPRSKILQPRGARRCDGTRAQANESSTPAGATELRKTSIACCHGGVASRTLRQGPTEVKPFADRDSFVIFLPLGIGRPPEEFTLGPTVMTDGRR